LLSLIVTIISIWGARSKPRRSHRQHQRARAALRAVADQAL